MTRTWFITGCSTGFGRALARHLIDLGHRVVVTARDPAQAADLVAEHPATALALRLDVTDPAQVGAATARFGAIDVLVNTAGAGSFGAVEESGEAAVRALFALNVWDLASVTRAALPMMRARRLGTIVNISSIGGLRAMPSLGFYAATKHAVESLAQEVAPLGH